jgi:hypothetical protein
MFALIGLPPRTDFLGTLAALLLLYGLISLVWGIARWNNSASEIKAIERSASLGASPRSAEHAPGLPSSEPVSMRTEARSTDPIQPGSVTEQTTRQLEQSRPHLENQNQ